MSQTLEERKSNFFPFKVVGAREYGRMFVNDLYNILMIEITTQSMTVFLRM